MIKRGQKRGQFYLLAAIVIISVIIGFAGVSNYYKKSQSVKVYDLGEELNIEGDNVLDYGVINEDKTKIEDFAGSFSGYAESGDKEIYFIFGDKDGITVRSFDDINTGIITAGSSTINIIQEGAVDQTFTPLGDKINVSIEGNNYEFNIKEGENFYFVIFQNVGEERFVITGEMINEES